MRPEKASSADYAGLKRTHTLLVMVLAGSADRWRDEPGGRRLFDPPPPLPVGVPGGILNSVYDIRQ